MNSKLDCVPLELAMNSSLLLLVHMVNSVQNQPQPHIPHSKYLLIGWCYLNTEHTDAIPSPSFVKTVT